MKYGDECPDAQVTEVACVALTLKRNGRQRLPSVLILSECDIEKAGDEEEVERKCEGVRELDLSRNKLKEWKEVRESINVVEWRRRMGEGVFTRFDD